MLLLLSRIAPLIEFCRTGCDDGVPEPDGFVLPVMRSLLKASTSSEALVVPDPILSGVGRSNSASRFSVAVFTEGSIVARVFWKGFMGTIVLVDPDAFSPTAEFVRVFLTSSSSSFPSPSPSVSLLKGSPKDSSAESDDIVGDAGDGEPM